MSATKEKLKIQIEDMLRNHKSRQQLIEQLADFVQNKFEHAYNQGYNDGYGGKSYRY